MVQLLQIIPGVITIIDDESVPTVGFASSTSSNAESTSSAAIAVNLSTSSSSTITVNYTVSGTATGSGTDYTLANGAITFAAGETSKNITIASIISDALDEPNETVILTLSDPTNASLGTIEHTYTITDDDQHLHYRLMMCLILNQAQQGMPPLL